MINIDATRSASGGIIQFLISLFVVFVYMTVWVFFGALFGGAYGFAAALILALTLVLLTLLWGDKVLMLLLGAKELSLKNLLLSSLLSNYSCRAGLRPMKFFKFFGANQVCICVVNSLLSGRSLIVSERVMASRFHHEIIKSSLAGVGEGRSVIADLALMLCYQMLFPGYLLGGISAILKRVYFFLFYPIVFFKFYITRSRPRLPVNRRRAPALVNVSDRWSDLIADIVFDYSIVEMKKRGLWDSLITGSLPQSRANDGL